MKKLIEKVFGPNQPPKFWDIIKLIILFLSFVLVLSLVAATTVSFFKSLLINGLNDPFVGFGPKDAQFFEVFKMFVGLISIGVGLTGPALLFYFNTKQSKRGEIEFTYGLLREWREAKLSKASYKIRTYFLNKDLSEQAESLYDASNEMENKGLRLAVRELLNYFETVSSAYNDGHVNTEVVKKYFYDAFILYYKRFLPYINRTQENAYNLGPGKAKIYSDFTNLVENWLQEGQAQGKSKS